MFGERFNFNSSYTIKGDAKMFGEKEDSGPRPVGYYFVYSGKIPDSVDEVPTGKLLARIPVMEPIGMNLEGMSMKGKVITKGTAKWFRYIGKAIIGTRVANIVTDGPLTCYRKVRTQDIIQLDERWSGTG